MNEEKIKETLYYFACKYKGNFKQIIQALVAHEIVDDSLLRKFKKEYKNKYITILSPEYPDKLKCIESPPIVLFYKGDISLLKEKSISVIGMRYNSKYGEIVTRNLVKELVKYQFTIVSGLAKGIDRIAHETAINQQGKTIGVLGCGIDYIYPACNQEIYQKMIQSQLIISEFPGLTVPTKDKFPSRNRIISGLSEAILVTEAKKRSGTMITVGFGLDQGKIIFAVPSPITQNNGTNYIIQQGARVVIDMEDILDELNLY